MALEDTLWIYHGAGCTARLADPHHRRRVVGPFTIYAVLHPITAQCTQCYPPCVYPCAGALQQPLPTPPTEGAYSWTLYPETKTLTSYRQQTATTPYHPISSNTWQPDRPIS